MSSDMVEVELGIAYEQELEALGAQRDDLSGLQGRAKDILGLVTLAGSFFGAFRQNETKALLSDASWQEWFSVIAPAAILVGACLFVLTPQQKWMFNIDGASIKSMVLARPPAQRGFSSKSKLYLAYIDRLNHFQHQNRRRLVRRMWALYIAILALVVEIVAVALLLVA